MPEIIEVTPGFQIIIMPESHEPSPVDQELAHDLGYLNALVDIGEAAAAGSVLFGNGVGWSTQLGLSLVDIFVASSASIAAGESGTVRLHDSLPVMLVIGQDILLTTGEAVAVPATQVGLTYYGMSAGAIPGAMAGFVAGQELDIGTSALSAAYDIGRAEGVIPQVVSVAVYWDHSASTRIPLPLMPQGQPVLAIVLYH